MSCTKYHQHKPAQHLNDYQNKTPQDILKLKSKQNILYNELNIISQCSDVCLLNVKVLMYLHAVLIKAPSARETEANPIKY